MPPQIDAAVGDYRHGIDSNHAAVLSDDIYFARETGTLRLCKIVLRYDVRPIRRRDIRCKKLEQVIDSNLLSVKSSLMADSSRASWEVRRTC